MNLPSNFLVSNFSFKFNLYRYNEARVAAEHAAAVANAAAALAAENEAGLLQEIENGDRALRGAETRWQLDFEALEFNLSNLGEAHEALKSRMDFERERFLTMNGDLQVRLDAVTHEYAEYKRATDESMSAFSSDATDGRGLSLAYSRPRVYASSQLF